MACCDRLIALLHPPVIMTIVPTQLPFLAEICWQLQDLHHLTPPEMLRRHERGWHYRSGPLKLEEQRFIDQLVQQYGSWINTVFARDQHQKILSILSQLRASFLADCQIHFGGGTLLALKYSELGYLRALSKIGSSSVNLKEIALKPYVQSLSYARPLR